MWSIAGRRPDAPHESLLKVERREFRCLGGSGGSGVQVFRCLGV